MPDVLPLRALHYSLPRVGGLDRVTAPPYDVIGAALRRELAGRSPHNVVHVDLPQGPDPYDAAKSILSNWKGTGVLERDSEPALWPLIQEYTGPDGTPRARHGFFARVRLEEYDRGRIRPHERTHAAPKEDRLHLTRATRTNLSPVFGLYEDAQGKAWRALEPVTESEPWAKVVDGEGTVHRLWRAGIPEIATEVATALRDTEILIADGHHRYETALTYASEVGGDGDHRYVLMCLVATNDPGLTVFPIHRLLSGIDVGRLERLKAGIERDFKTQPLPIATLTSPDLDSSPGVFGYLDVTGDDPLRITVASFDTLDELLKDHSPAYRRLDTAVLETLVLRHVLGLSDEDIAQKRGLVYTKDAGEAVNLVRSGECQAAFLLRPTPINQVQDIAAAGETMPPKSTYFYPKLLSGMLFNPLE